MEQFFTVFDRYGIAVGMLAVLGVGIWKICRWIAPRAEEAIRRHFTFIDRLDSNQIKQGENQIKQGEVLDRILERQEAQSDSVLKISKALARACDNLEKLEARSRPKE